MKRFIFLTNQYLPKPGATGLCVHYVARELVSQKNFVEVICFENSEKTDSEEIVDGVKIHRIKIPWYLKKSSLKVARGKRIIAKATKYLMSLINIFNYPLKSLALANAFVSKTKQLIVDAENATLIASYTPAEAVFAVNKIKKSYPSMKTVYYSLDTLSNECGNSGLIPPSIRKKMGMKLEKKFFSNFDKIIIMECHRDFYQSDCFKKFQSKYYVANFPLLVKTLENVTNKVCCSKDNSRRKKLVFAGNFYRSLRNPSFMCFVLSSLEKVCPVEVFFLGGGDCQDVLEKLQREYPDKIHIMGLQPHCVACEYINSADVLLSVGNVDSPMAPSKIYEYMATGKPIIHFYSYDKDPCIEPLRKYKNALLIKKNENVKIDEVCHFLQNDLIRPFSEIEKDFQTSTPIYTATIINA